MCGNGLRAEIELRGDFLRRPSFAEEPENLEFAVTQFFDRRNRRTARTLSGKGTEHARGEPRADVDRAAEHLADGGDHRRVVAFLHQVTFRAGFERALRVEHFVVHRDDEHFHFGIQGNEILDEIESAATGHGEVGDDEIGLFAREEFDRLPAGRCRGADDHVRLRIEHQLVAREHHGVIVHEQDARLR